MAILRTNEHDKQTNKHDKIIFPEKHSVDMFALKGVILIMLAIFILVIISKSCQPDLSFINNSSYCDKVKADEYSSKLSVNFTEFGVPNINSYFKSYMDYRAVTDKNSPQYQFIHTYGWCDENGFMRATGERDLGIENDYYLIALGSYYGTSIGTKYKITLDTGRVFYGVLGDCKADIHTNSTHQYSGGKNVVEFLVDTRYLRNDVKYHGSANVYMPLNGNVQKIERIDFVY